MTKHLKFNKSLFKRRLKKKKQQNSNKKRKHANKSKTVIHPHAKLKETFIPESSINAQQKESGEEDFHFQYQENEEENDLNFSYNPPIDFPNIQNTETNDIFIESNKLS